MFFFYRYSKETVNWWQSFKIGNRSYENLIFICFLYICGVLRFNFVFALAEEWLIIGIILLTAFFLNGCGKPQWLRRGERRTSNGCLGLNCCWLMNFRYLTSGEKLVWEEEHWSRRGRKSSRDRDANTSFWCAVPGNAWGLRPYAVCRDIGIDLGINHPAGRGQGSATTQLLLQLSFGTKYPSAVTVPCFYLYFSGWHWETKAVSITMQLCYLESTD